MNRRRFLISTAVAAGAVQAADIQAFATGIVPAGRGRSSDPVEAFWSNCDEVSGLGFHRIEINNTRIRIAEAYAERVSEFKDGIAARGLTLVGVALFSQIAERDLRQDLIERHMVLGRLLAAVGGKYITHMISPGSELNEPSSDDAYRTVDLKAWAANGNEIGKRLLEECGVALAYHPEQGEIRLGMHDRILAATDDRYFRFLADTGHLAAGGADSVAICLRYRPRLECVHLKDFSPAAGKPAKPGNVPFGEGVVNLPAIMRLLRDTNFTGFVLSESGGTNHGMRDYMTGTLRLSI